MDGSVCPVNAAAASLAKSRMLPTALYSSLPPAFPKGLKPLTALVQVQDREVKVLDPTDQLNSLEQMVSGVLQNCLTVLVPLIKCK